mmetsp:Transcript_16107/g.32251  ORF Transcript_16107/g.32251 Transcript_16107/m.32251 type:complete len:378 (-) Transcript_16107:238-1371(-)|eukprot:CAMPEP_0181306398 /NCGR_PEP_ID=MMETSP1101-20121128/10276_1 /TAXON_ID=46948 /ORGANISM="Rhodomonas abbreviata, Strain Caron Lab Isolate" /LENGTH=377 /DNA_ID=CAMNT_0023412447 /DNA_START=18 /DNA_END=1151 /DNA_ORIENTATION=-
MGGVARGFPLIVMLASASAFAFNSPLCTSTLRFSPSVCSRASTSPSILRAANSKESALSLRAAEGGNQQDGGKSLIDEVASKGIWQGGMSGEAKEALARVGWVDGDEEGGETASDGGDGAAEFGRDDIETIVQRAVAEETFVDERSKEMFEDETRTKLIKELVKREVKADYGVELEDLLNPIKVVSLEKKIFIAEQALEGLPSGEERAQTEDDIARFRSELAKERKSIMMDWLKVLFRGQALLSVLIGGLLASDHVPLVEHVPIAGRAFGFWTMWLFTIPSLRAVKPLGYPNLQISPSQEKKALNLAFVVTPLSTILLPFATKDPSLIFSANLAIVSACYAFYALRPDDDDSAGEVEIKGILKYLDYGSGRERGARK